MNCKRCGRYTFFSDFDMCEKCQKTESKKLGLTNHYRNLDRFNLEWAVLNCRKKGFSLEEIAEILDRDLRDIESVWDIIVQDGR